MIVSNIAMIALIDPLGKKSGSFIIKKNFFKKIALSN